MIRHRFLLAIVLLLLAALCGCGSGSKSSDVPPGDGFTFIALGDNRPARESDPQPETFSIVLDDAAQAGAVFAVNSGDCIYGSSDLTRVEAMYDEYANVVSTHFGMPMHLAIGNHEIRARLENQELFERETGHLYYSFDYQNSHFIMLDTDLYGEECRISGEQLAWLEGDLQAAQSSDHIFVFLHRPLFPVGTHIGSSLDEHPDDRDALHQLFVDSKVDTVFAAHEHLFSRQIRDGVQYIITAGAGAPLHGTDDSTTYFHHYIRVEVSDGDTRMTVVRPAMDGQPRTEMPIER